MKPILAVTRSSNQPNFIQKRPDRQSYCCNGTAVLHLTEQHPSCNLWEMLVLFDTAVNVLNVLWFWPRTVLLADTIISTNMMSPSEKWRLLDAVIALLLYLRRCAAINVWCAYKIFTVFYFVKLCLNNENSSSSVSILLPPIQRTNNSVARCLVHLSCNNGIIRLYIQPPVTPTQNLWITNCKFISNYFEIIQSFVCVSSAFEVLSLFKLKFT